MMYCSDIIGTMWQIIGDEGRGSAQMCARRRDYTDENPCYVHKRDIFNEPFTVLGHARHSIDEYVSFTKNDFVYIKILAAKGDVGYVWFHPKWKHIKQIA